MANRLTNLKYSYPDDSGSVVVYCWADAVAWTAVNQELLLSLFNPPNVRAEDLFVPTDEVPTWPKAPTGIVLRPSPNPHNLRPRSPGR